MYVLLYYSNLKAGQQKNIKSNIHVRAYIIPIKIICTCYLKKHIQKDNTKCI